MQLPNLSAYARSPSMAKLNMVTQGRASEWLTSFILMGFALILAVPGDTLSSTKGFQAFAIFGVDETFLSTSLTIVAGLRIAALHINGRWRRSPILRMVGAILGTLLFALLGMAFLYPTIHNGAALSSGVSTYFTLAFFDALSAYRSGADVRMVQQLRGRP